MTHHIIPGSQIDASQALPHKTHAQHQESAHAEILDHGHGMAVQGAAIDGNGRGMAGRAMVGTTVDDMQAQLTVHDIMASMPAPAAARTSVENVQDVLAALDHLEVVRMAAAGVERRRAAPAQAEGDAAGRCRAQGGDTRRVDALMEKWDDDGATRGSAFIELRDLARELEHLAATTQAAPVDESREDMLVGATYALRTIAEGSGDQAGVARAALRVIESLDMGATTQASTAQAEIDRLRAALRDVRHSLQFINDTPGGAIQDTLWMMHGSAPETVFDFIDAALEPATSSTDAQAAAEVRDAWISVDERLPAVGELVLVYSPPTKHDHPGEVNIGFDCIDPNDDDHASWLSHNEHYEHFCCVAKPEGSIGPSADAPYTHWMPLPEAPAIRSAGDTGGAQ